MSIPPWQAAQCKLLDAAMKVAYIAVRVLDHTKEMDPGWGWLEDS